MQFMEELLLHSTVTMGHLGSTIFWIHHFAFPLSLLPPNPCVGGQNLHSSFVVTYLKFALQIQTEFWRSWILHLLCCWAGVSWPHLDLSRVREQSSTHQAPWCCSHLLKCILANIDTLPELCTLGQLCMWSCYQNVTWLLKKSSYFTCVLHNPFKYTY